MHESHPADAPSQSCRQCHGRYRATAVRNYIQSLSFVSITSVVTPAFEQHVKTCANICDILHVGTGHAADVELSALLSTKPTFNTSTRYMQFMKYEVSELRMERVKLLSHSSQQ